MKNSKDIKEETKGERKEDKRKNDRKKKVEIIRKKAK
jgi:hypothetical protein